MSYTEKTTQSYGSRLGGSLKGMLTGLIMFVAATALLWWNEGRTVKQSDAIKDAEKAFVEMENPKKIDPALDGELVYACCLAETADTLVDQLFGIKANAINMVRKVEYYQYVESAKSKSEDKLGGSRETTTTYTYKADWCNSPINSSEFRDPAYQGKNTILANIENEAWEAENVSFGAYTLPEFVIASLYADEKLNLSIDENKLKEWEKNLAPKASNEAPAEAVKDSAVVKNDSIEVPSMTYETEYIHVGANQIYLGKNPASPQIGDIRIEYTVCSSTKCSLIAKVKGNTFARYKTDNGKMFSLVQKGAVESDQMIQNAKDANNAMKWVWRILGLLLIYIALRMLLAFPETLLKVVPILSTILGTGVGIICILLTIIWGGLIIAIAWLFYRPILSICILAVVAAAAFALWKYRKNNKVVEA